ncbi:MAG: putative glycolipid-binding domain-containing protein [Pseudonocardia sp.]|nr:putative glycolipid-binding domain-containing protein [Pseudonocardia sp.]
MTTMLTWQADGRPGLEGARLLPASAGGGFRALSRMVLPTPEGDLTASFSVTVGDDGTLARLSLSSATAERERHLTANRTDDGFWMLDDGSGVTRREFAAVDVDVAFSPLFASLPIRRLDLHREAGVFEVPVVQVSLPDLDVALVTRRYRTVRTLTEDGTAVVACSAGADGPEVEIVVDEAGFVLSYPGVASRLAHAPASTVAG